MRLIAFGCSLSRQGSNCYEIPNHYGNEHKSGVIHQTAKLLNLDYLNYAVSSSGIDEQVYRFNEYMATEYSPDDIILWQMTSIYRDTITCGFNNINVKSRKIYGNTYDIKPNIKLVKDNFQFSVQPSLIDKNKNYLLFLSHSDLIKKQIWDSTRIQSVSERKIISAIGVLKTIKNLGNKHLAWKGWNEIMDKNELAFFENQIINSNINYMFLSYLDWIKSKQLPLTDSHHPCPHNAAPIYAEKVLYPKLKRIIEAT